MSATRSFLRSRSGAAAAEFALVLPVALLFFFGIIDIGRYAWRINELEKAVQMGTRYAVATSVLSPDLRAETYVGATCGSGTLTPGDTICKEALGVIRCTQSGCTCAQNPCPDVSAVDTTGFNLIVNRMRVVAPFVGPADVEVNYSGSGIGYAGDPATDDDGNDLSEVAPIVTVAVRNTTMRMLLLLGGRVNLPSFSYSQTLEDGVGTVAH